MSIINKQKLAQAVESDKSINTFIAFYDEVKTKVRLLPDDGICYGSKETKNFANDLDDPDIKTLRTHTTAIRKTHGIRAVRTFTTKHLYYSWTISLYPSNQIVTSRLTQNFDGRLVHDLDLYAVKKEEEGLKCKLTDNKWHTVDPNETLGRQMTPLVYNSKRGFLAGIADYRELTSYHIWKPSEYEGFKLIRKTKPSVRVPRCYYNYVRCMDFSNDGLTIAILCSDRSLSMYDVNTNELKSTTKLEGPEMSQTFATFCRWSSVSDNQIFILGGLGDHILRIIDTEKGVVVAKTQSSIQLSHFDLSTQDPNMLVCSLLESGTACVYDMRRSLYFPVLKLAQYKHEIENAVYEPCTKINSRENYTIYPIPWLLQEVEWSKSNKNEFLCMSVDQISVIDIRNATSRAAGYNLPYSSACYFNLQP